MSILNKPVISEKTMKEVSSGKYTIFVNPNSSKHQIAHEIKLIYKVDVVKVNTIKVKSEEKIIRGKYRGRTKILKKAIITLKKGQKIEGFEVKE